eukprot:jgi/Ulvmu1/5737/UM245_0005.1
MATSPHTLPLTPGVHVDAASLAAAVARRGTNVLAVSLASTLPSAQPPVTGEGLSQGDRTVTSVRSAIFICAAATIAVVVLWWAKRRSDSRRRQGHYVHDGNQQRRDLVQYNEALRQRRIQALVQQQVTNGEMQAQQATLEQPTPPPPPTGHPTIHPTATFSNTSPFSTPPGSFSHPRTFPGVATGGLGPAGAMSRIQGGSGGGGVGAMASAPSRGHLVGHAVHPGVTMWGSHSAWNTQQGAQSASTGMGQHASIRAQGTPTSMGQPAAVRMQGAAPGMGQSASPGVCQGVLRGTGQSGSDQSAQAVTMAPFRW